jgi:hypothetical protein
MYIILELFHVGLASKNVSYNGNGRQLCPGLAGGGC